MGGQPERDSLTPDWDDDQTGYRADEVVTVKPVKLLHTDFASVIRGPCVRDSLLWGMNLSVAGFLARFMMTSDIRKSGMFAVPFGSVCFLAKLVYCRVQLIRERTKIYQMEPAFASYREMYGTDKDKMKKLEEDDVPVNDKL